MGREDPLEEEMATHSSILAWEISWTEDSGGLEPRGSARAEKDWATKGAYMKLLWWALMSLSKMTITSRKIVGPVRYKVRCEQ